MTPMGIATSFCKALELGILSVVTLKTERSELNSSREPAESYAYEGGYPAFVVPTGL
jgi:hypothetical protein